MPLHVYCFAILLAVGGSGSTSNHALVLVQTAAADADAADDPAVLEQSEEGAMVSPSVHLARTVPKRCCTNPNTC